jgi:hypothetical protein
MILKNRKPYFIIIVPTADLGASATNSQYLMVVDVIVAIAMSALDGQQVKIRPIFSFSGDTVNGAAALTGLPAEHTVTVKLTAPPLSNTQVRSSLYISLTEFL